MIVLFYSKIEVGSRREIFGIIELMYQRKYKRR